MASSSKWRLLDTNYQSPFLNVALEEAMFRVCEEGYFIPTVRMWTNDAAVVVGRFQDVSLEVDASLCQREKILIVRRFTGGGTVYHDKGNLNITILNRRQDMEHDAVQARNISMIRNALSKLGVNSSINPPNSLMVDGKKISGSASAMNRNFILWHASLLVSTDLKTLHHVLSSGKDTHNTIHVRSRQQPTVTLQQFLGEPVQLTKVKHCLLESIDDVFGVETLKGSISRREEIAAHLLSDRKYSRDSWTYDGQEAHDVLDDLKRL